MYIASMVTHCNHVVCGSHFLISQLLHRYGFLYSGSQMREIPHWQMMNETFEDAVYIKFL